MDVKEFRTGNLLNYTTAEGDVLPSTLDWQDFKWLEEDKKGFELVHDYIPLTEKWLLDFGFKKDSNGHYRIYHGRNIPVRLWKRGKDDWVCIKSNARPKYVHQLQNLYFALTGEELIKK